MNYKKSIIILILLIGVAIIYFIQLEENTVNDNFDPSIYFEGNSVSPQDMEGVFTEEELEEIDRLFNEE